MADFYLHWKDAEEGDDPFQEIDLLHCPRKGEELCFPLMEQGTDEVICNIQAEVREVIHVAEGPNNDAYIELTLREVARTEIEEEEEEDEFELVPEEEDDEDSYTRCARCHGEKMETVCGEKLPNARVVM